MFDKVKQSQGLRALGEKREEKKEKEKKKGRKKREENKRGWETNRKQKTKSKGDSDSVYCKSLDFLWNFPVLLPQ